MDDKKKGIGYWSWIDFLSDDNIDESVFHTLLYADIHGLIKISSEWRFWIEAWNRLIKI